MDIWACVVLLIRCVDGYGILLDSFMINNRTGVTRRVSLEGQELFILPHHLRLSRLLYIVWYQPVSFSYFSNDHVLWLSTSEYPFDIFKLFLNMIMVSNIPIITSVTTGGNYIRQNSMCLVSVKINLCNRSIILKKWITCINSIERTLYLIKNNKTSRIRN